MRQALAGVGLLVLAAGVFAWGRLVRLRPVIELQRALSPEDPWGLSELSPTARARVGSLLSELAGRGYRYRVLDVWRSAAEQEALFQSVDAEGRAPTRTRDSLHERTDAAGRPAADAVDLEPTDTPAGPVRSDDDRAAGYIALRDEAPDHGLTTGGSWSLDGGRWSAYGLGWDPGHVQVAT